MSRVNRAGRVHQIHMVLQAVEKRNPRGSVTTGFIAKKLGIRSSTYLRNLLFHMVEIGLVQEMSTAPSNGRGDRFRAWRIASYEQKPLPTHEIVINARGRSFVETMIGGF